MTTPFRCAVARALYAASALILLACAPAHGVERIHREHGLPASGQFEELAVRSQLGPRGLQRGADLLLTRKEAEEDLDELEWLIDNTHSYRELRGIDYRAGLDRIRGSLDDRVSVGEFACQLTKLIHLFGDGHARVSTFTLSSLSSSFSPFLIQESDRRLVAFKPDRSGFVEPGFPFIRTVDGVPMDRWLDASARWCANGSPQLVRHTSIRGLRYIEFLRQELGIRPQDSVRVELESTDGQTASVVEVPLASAKPIYGQWPRTESTVLSGNIGYLRIPSMSDKAEFLDGLVETMHAFRETSGLIIDVRGNGGGSRAPLRTLFPFFMDPGDAPRVVNVAAYRLGVAGRREAFKGRYLHPVSFAGWSREERAAVERFAVSFRPEWTLPEGQFSEWHYFVISASDREGDFHYAKPVVVLMNTACFSATDIFLGAFKGWRDVTLMGSSSGGGSGCRVATRLKHSKIEVYLSSMASFRPNGWLYDTRGIGPDIPAQPRPTDFLGETDSVLDKALEHLANLSSEKD